MRRTNIPYSKGASVTQLLQEVTSFTHFQLGFHLFHTFEVNP